MRNFLWRGFAVVFVGLVPGLLRAAPKAQDAYLVHPSTQTVKRREAVLAMGRSKDAQSGPALMEALTDKDPMTRSLAAQGIGTLKFAVARRDLEKVLAGDAYPEVRQAAAMSLRQIEDPQAAGALELALKDPAVNVRLVALSGISHYGDVKSRAVVEAACKDKSVEVRRTAVYVLGRLGDPAAVPAIQKLLSDPDAAVRSGAAQALGDLRSADSRALLLPLLKDPGKTARASAARSLMMLGDNSAFEVAKALDQDPDFGVRVVAIDALGWSKDPAAETELQSLLALVPANSRPAVQEALTRTQQLRKQ